MLEQSHVFVSASRMEVQSLVVIEALASGTPVVGLSNETVDELVDETNGARLSKDADPETFALAIQRICELPASEYKKRCERARERVKDLDWSNVMRRTVESYEMILAQQDEKSSRASTSDFLAKYVSQIPAGRLHDDILTITTNLSLPANEKHLLPAKAMWITSLNIVAAVAAFYFVKGPVSIIQKLNQMKGGRAK